MLARNALPPQPRSTEQVETLLLRLNVEMNQCRELHTVHCAVHLETWLEDHPAPDVDMAQVYAAQTESEAEAEERLEGTSSWEDDDTILPESSF